MEYDLSEKNVFFLTTTDFHFLRLAKETNLINISFDQEAIDEMDIASRLFLKTQKAYSFNTDEPDRIIMASELLRHECECEGECQGELLKYVLGCILKKNTAIADAVTLKKEHYRGIKKAIVYLELHFKNDITLSDVAAEAGYHPTYFPELFKKVTGETFTSALMRRRIGYARMLLSNGISATDACFLSGFRSFSNFSSTFKKTCNVSPGQYRVKYREG